jgi:hypothetical protein
VRGLDPYQSISYKSWRVFAGIRLYKGTCGTWPKKTINKRSYESSHGKTNQSSGPAKVFGIFD